MLGALDEEVIMRPTIRSSSRATSRPRALATTVIASAVLLAAAACGSTAPQPSASPAAAPGAAATKASSASSRHEVSALKTASTPLGDVVTDGNGMTLYIFTKDSKDKPSTCVDACATSWPPVLAAASAPTAGSGVESSEITEIARPDGTKQIAYYGMPLYRYAKDTSPGQTAGEGVNSVWYVVNPEGSAIK